jgi:N-acetyl-anhydromuramyl-L-alanine amidase AmpD
LRYNRGVRPRKMSRRQFLAGLPVLAAAGLAPPTPPAPTTATSDRREYFVPVEHYHELPPECYAQNLIRPLEIILHWDGNQLGRDMWVVAVTFETLKYLRQSAHFAVDSRRVWQMLPMHRTTVQESFGARGYNWRAINIEMCGTDFDVPDNYPPEGQIRQTVRLVSHLMDFYSVPFDFVVGHYERDDRGDKRDPGVRFMADFREHLAEYRRELSPVKRQHLAG